MGSLRRAQVFACLMALLQTGPAAAAAVALTPANTRVGLTVFALGLFPQSGHFSQFAGQLEIDPGHPDDCRVALQVHVASLAMSNSETGRLALGASMLDVAHFPTMSFHGTCTLTHTEGQLTLHGVTHDLGLADAMTGGRIDAAGALRRQDYGVSGLPGLIGRTVRIVFSVDLPPPLAAQFAAPAR